MTQPSGRPGSTAVTEPSRALVAARVRTVVSVAAGIGCGLLFATRLPGSLAVLLGWVVTSLVYLCWVLVEIRRRGGANTAEHAQAIDPDRITSDSLLIVSAVISLVAVGFVLARAAKGGAEFVQVALALCSVVQSWTMVHTMYMLRYARLYYASSEACIDFNGTDEPTYGDFAYFAFTVGMTYQVSDTTLKGGQIRRTVLRHSLLSYLFGTGIVASAVSLVSSLVG